MSDRYYAIEMAPKPPAPSDLADKFMLRMPDGMRDRIAEAAKENGRSMNAEIVRRLADSFVATRVQKRTGMPLPSTKALQAARDAVQFAIEHRLEIERIFDEKGIEVPWLREGEDDETSASPSKG